MFFKTAKTFLEIVPTVGTGLNSAAEFNCQRVIKFILAKPELLNKLMNLDVEGQLLYF